MSATAVGVACGFRSSSHFSRAFKARYGRSPSVRRD
jgi:transcriptional regulator GlxA family with amidase domain